MYCSAVLATVFSGHCNYWSFKNEEHALTSTLLRDYKHQTIIVICVMYSRRKGKCQKCPVCKEKGNFTLNRMASPTNNYLGIPYKPLLKEWTIRTSHVKLLCKICNSLVSVIKVLLVSLYGRNNKVQGTKVKIDVNKQFHHLVTKW